MQLWFGYCWSQKKNREEIGSCGTLFGTTFLAKPYILHCLESEPLPLQALVPLTGLRTEADGLCHARCMWKKNVLVYFPPLETNHSWFGASPTGKTSPARPGNGRTISLSLTLSRLSNTLTALGSTWTHTTKDAGDQLLMWASACPSHDQS